jgi:hypothetical protein
MSESGCVCGCEVGLWWGCVGADWSSSFQLNSGIDYCLCLEEPRYSATEQMPPDDLLSELAGNAFSGFALFPVLSAAMASAGALAQLQAKSRVRTLKAQLSRESVCSSLSFDSTFE